MRIAHGTMPVWCAAVWPPQGLSHSDTGGTDDITASRWSNCRWMRRTTPSVTSRDVWIRRPHVTRTSPALSAPWVTAEQSASRRRRHPRPGCACSSPTWISPRHPGKHTSTAPSNTLCPGQSLLRQGRIWHGARASELERADDAGILDQAACLLAANLDFAAADRPEAAQREIGNFNSHRKRPRYGLFCKQGYFIGSTELPDFAGTRSSRFSF